jgi:hypothetical protein
MQLSLVPSQLLPVTLYWSAQELVIYNIMARNNHTPQATQFQFNLIIITEYTRTKLKAIEVDLL